ncbi:MAG: ABC transporter permease [Firmicutes bacterium]|nr:ABC transporter permease [Bacillota bacterium]
MKNKRMLAGPYLFWAVSFVVIPLLVIVYYAFTSDDGSFTFANLAQITTPENLKALGMSILLSFLSTVFCLLLAYPLAMILSQKKVNQTSFVVLIFILPMWMNFLLRTMAWQVLLERNGIINQVLGMIGIDPLNIINTPYAVVLGMVYDYLPFMVLPIYNALIKIDRHVIEAAYDLGASHIQVLRKIIVPLSVPGIVSGITMVFVPSLTTFAVSNMLGGGKVNLIGNIIEQEFTASSNWNLGAGLSLVMMIFIVISMALIEKFDRNGEGNLI